MAKTRNIVETKVEKVGSRWVVYMRNPKMSSTWMRFRTYLSKAEANSTAKIMESS